MIERCVKGVILLLILVGSMGVMDIMSSTWSLLDLWLRSALFLALAIQALLAAIVLGARMCDNKGGSDDDYSSERD